jgi:hypothetical protein
MIMMTGLIGIERPLLFNDCENFGVSSPSSRIQAGLSSFVRSPRLRTDDTKPLTVRTTVLIRARINSRVSTFAAIADLLPVSASTETGVSGVRSMNVSFATPHAAADVAGLERWR